MWVRTQLKIGCWDLLAGAWNCFKSKDRETLRRGVESFFADNDDTIVTYSVRSGFDLLIQALELEPGDEVIFSALNVRGMVRVARDAGLVAVPVDLDRGSMGPSLEKLQAAITPRSRVFVAAHLFGTRLDLDPLFEFCRNKGIVAVEDCAQAFNGRAYPGNLKADLNMFSFGPIKTSTALGGALIRVRDDRLRGRMRTIQATYPVQADAKHLKRIVQFMGLKLITSRLILGAIYKYYHSRGQDYEDALADRVRDVAPLKTAKNLRFQPSTAMLALLSRRLEEFDIQAIRVRTNKGEKLRDMIGVSVAMPAQGNAHHDYWVFPLVVDEPRKFIDGLRAEGFDAADLPRSQHIAAPKDRPELEPQIAAGVMRDLVVIPCYDTMPDEELKRQAQVIKRLAGEAIPAKA